MDKVEEQQIREIIPCYTPMKDLPEGLTLEDTKEMFYTICLIREFEMKIRDLWRAGKITGICHAYYYAEAIAVGACKALQASDYITSTHRGHGHALAKGASPDKMLAELYGKQEGYNNGKGGSMHIADVDSGILGATGIVGNGIAPATGAALSAKLQKNGKVSLSFFGDGASNQGPFYECMNMAAAWNLPVVYLCEYNQWAIGTDFWRVTREHDVYKRAIGFGVPSVQVDGFNVFEVYKAVKEAVDRARAGEGPTLVEARYMRMLGHHVGDDQNYRTKEELDRINVLYDIEPVVRTKQFLISAGVSEEEVDGIHEKAVQRILQAVDFAETQCTEPSLDTLYLDIYANGEIIK